ncbi:hypothetical protein FJTKL_08603 [Diaporthe vaccinii]|uniref:Uncharacterized protein n=1 Tax=Diaporthe vaccinii TaxID=105482 RepID=A0ABR4EQN8_9PEZI
MPSGLQKWLAWLTQPIDPRAKRSMHSKEHGSIDILQPRLAQSPPQKGVPSKEASSAVLYHERPSPPLNKDSSVPLHQFLPACTASRQVPSSVKLGRRSSAPGIPRQPPSNTAATPNLRRHTARVYLLTAASTFWAPSLMPSFAFSRTSSPEEMAFSRPPHLCQSRNR